MSWTFQRERGDTENLDSLSVVSLTGATQDLKVATHSTQIIRVRGFCLVAEAATDYRFYSKNPTTNAKTYLQGKITLAAAGSGGPVADSESGWFETLPGETLGMDIGAGNLSGHVKIQYLN